MPPWTRPLSLFRATPHPANQNKNRIVSEVTPLRHASNRIPAACESGRWHMGAEIEIDDKMTQIEIREIEKKKTSSDSFYDYEKGFDELWVEFGRRSLEGSLGKISVDRRKKKNSESFRGNTDK